MVGLPTENEDDIEATADLILRLKRKTKGLRYTLGISTFVPKAQTPFQWNGVNQKAKIRLKKLTKKLESNAIQARPESYGWSVIQALISRSDRRLAPILAAMRHHPKVSLGEWKKTYLAACNGEINPKSEEPIMPPWEEIIYHSWSTSKVLPWTHLEGPLKTEQLINHKSQSFNKNS